MTDIPAKSLSDLDEIFKHVQTDPNADNDYLRGYNNGIILSHATIFDHEPAFIEPAKAVETKQTETGWVIEKADSSPAKPLYFAGLREHNFILWSVSHQHAIRFSRQEDAEKIHTGVEVRIAQHAWN